MDNFQRKTRLAAGEGETYKLFHNFSFQPRKNVQFALQTYVLYVADPRGFEPLVFPVTGGCVIQATLWVHIFNFRVATTGLAPVTLGL